MTDDRKVRIGVVGCGVVATAYYLPWLMDCEQADLVAVCDRVEARTRASARLFGAGEQYLDYDEMIERADIDAVWILTAPGTHVSFTLKAVEAGRHVLIQKPMATTMDDARRIHAAVRAAGVKALVEPSSSTVLDAKFAEIRQLVRAGVLGDVLWFSLGSTGPTAYGPSLGMNPYGQAAFFDADSGGFLFDLPYAPTLIAGVLGACTSVFAETKIAVREHHIVPEEEYDRFLEAATDPHDANYWEVVVDLPRTKTVRMEAIDDAYSLYTMANGAHGTCHVGRTYHPTLPGTGSGGLQVFGTEGNLIFGGGHMASFISSRDDLLPRVDDDGWYHIAPRKTEPPHKWPIPSKGSFNYYHESSRHLIECILEDREPLVNVDWGLHITEMMAGAVESSKTGRRHVMTTSIDG